MDNLEGLQSLLDLLEMGLYYSLLLSMIHSDGAILLIGASPSVRSRNDLGNSIWMTLSMCSIMLHEDPTLANHNRQKLGAFHRKL